MHITYRHDFVHFIFVYRLGEHEQLTGEASSQDRRVLVASVSFAGGAVEPHSLSSVVDVTAGDHGGGPLGSAVLVEQMKKAGALKKVRWYKCYRSKAEISGFEMSCPRFSACSLLRVSCESSSSPNTPVELVESSLDDVHV